MNKKLMENIYKTVVEDGINIYKELYEKTKISESTVDYWKKALNFYNSLEINEKDMLLNIVEHTMIDTISSIFGVLDGTSSLREGEYEFDIKVNGISTECELQDRFLEYIEQKTE